VLKEEDTGGLTMKFGDAETMVKIVRMIAEREGFGDVLAEGSEKASEKLGKGKEFLTTSKGQEAPAHMPQVKRSLALIYAVNPFGADHESSDHDLTYDETGFAAYKDRYTAIGLTNPLPIQSLESGKVEFARIGQHLFSLMDCLNLCQFAWGPSWQLYGPDHIVRLVKSVTGWNVTIEELMEVGERRVNMMRVFNAREGINRNRDKLPDKFFSKGLKCGPTEGWRIDKIEFENALSEYYRQCGWDENTGIPKHETLERLGLDWTLGDQGL